MILNQFPPLTVSGDGWKDWPDVTGSNKFDLLKYLTCETDSDTGFKLLYMFGALKGSGSGGFELTLPDSLVYDPGGFYEVRRFDTLMGSLSIDNCVASPDDDSIEIQDDFGYVAGLLTVK